MATRTSNRIRNPKTKTVVLKEEALEPEPEDKLLYLEESDDSQVENILDSPKKKPGRKAVNKKQPPKEHVSAEDQVMEVFEEEQTPRGNTVQDKDGNEYIVLNAVETPSYNFKQENVSYLKEEIDVYEFPMEEIPDADKTVPGHMCKGCYRIFTSQGGLKRHLRACPNIADKLTVDKLEMLENVTNTLDDQVAEEEFEKEGICHCCGEDIENAHKEGEFSCNDCDSSFKLKSSLERHRRVIHSEGTTYDCPECNAKCPDKGTLAKHMYTHTGLKPYSCPVCHAEFTRHYHLVRHNYQTGCDGKKRPMFPCQVCGRIFNRKDNLREHLRAHAGQSVYHKKKVDCPQCQKSFVGQNNLNNHIQRVHIDGIPDSKPKKTLKERIESGEKPYQCDICQNSFSTSGAMKKHRRSHTGERPYECKECYAKFSAKETLNRHMKVHLNDKPHACEYCGKRFIQASQLKAHLFHHTGENGFTCVQCNTTFNRKARLELHIKYIHENADPFKCSVCEKDFIRKEDMNRHMLLHTGVKPHKCPICSKAFAMKSSLKIHLLTHTKEPPRSCQECKRVFIRQDCLLRHLRTKHRIVMDNIVADSDKKKLEAQLLEAAASELTSVLEDGHTDDEEVDNPSGSVPVLGDDELHFSIQELLTLLVDEETLNSFGWPDAPLDTVIQSVIKQCGHNPATESEEMSYADCLRENAKLLFTVVIDDVAVKQLLNNQTVDQVILHVLRLAKT